MTVTTLPESAVLELHGVDALSFAQSQFTSDLKALPEGTWQWSGWLTPKGRLVAFFAILRTDEQRLLLWLPAGGGEALRERLQRYVFRSKVSLRVLDDTIAIGVFGALPATLDGVPHIDLPVDADGSPRHLCLLPAAAADNADLAQVDDTAQARWRLADLQLGVPYVAAGAANSEQFVPQWLSLQRLSAFNLSKGCYPGQEIVARMHYLGQSKRAAWRLQGDGPPPQAMARVLDGDGNGIGDVVWAQADNAGWQALAVLSVDKADQVASVEGAGTASPHPLP